MNLLRKNLRMSHQIFEIIGILKGFEEIRPKKQPYKLSLQGKHPLALIEVFLINPGRPVFGLG